MTERKQVISALTIPSNQRQLCGYLGMAGFCRFQIPSLGLVAKPLYEALSSGLDIGLDSEPLFWSHGYQQAFDKIMG